MSPYERAISDMEKAENARIKAIIDYNIRIGVLKSPEDNNEICIPDSIDVVCGLGVEDEMKNEVRL